MPSFFDLEATSILGENVLFSEFEGNLSLVVNVASR
jgi:glutathione peroxidase-family protein